MLISVGDLVKVKEYNNKGSVPKNLVVSPADGSFIGSLYFTPAVQGQTGLVTSISRRADDDIIWVVPTVTVLLDTGLSVKLQESQLTRIPQKVESKKSGSLSPGGGKL